MATAAGELSPLAIRSVCVPDALSRTISPRPFSDTYAAPPEANANPDGALPGGNEAHPDVHEGDVA